MTEGEVAVVVVADGVEGGAGALDLGTMTTS